MSRRYIAGTTLEEALDCVKNLNSSRMSATLDVLGEDTTTEEQALDGEKIYQEAIRKINEHDLDANISVKLSMLGLRFDVSLCESIVRRLTQTAELHDSFVRIDMEDASVTRLTLDLYRKLRLDTDRIGVAVQAHLRSTVNEVRDLLEEGDTNLRVCKGIYIEPESLAYQDFKEVQESFKETVQRLLEGGATRVGIATHDPELVEAALIALRDLDVGKDRYEFQMLLGVAEKMRDQLVADGHPLRVYVPFGKEWYAYSRRRLRENPQIAGHVVRNLFPF
ncbi:MAG TPA: proline dehydrogenase [Planctomycetes bacterium]|nr:proline dehydrogenase [Planctomycetota bacterium]